MPPSDYEILWYPMRVTYNRELKIKKILDDLVIENFVPMQYDLVHSKGLPKKELVPAIHNLIFVRSNKITLTDLKRRNEELEPLRFMTRPITKGQKENEIIWVPDKQMDNFLRVASVQDNSVMFLENNDFINKIGKRVKITAGVAFIDDDDPDWVTSYDPVSIPEWAQFRCENVTNCVNAICEAAKEYLKSHNFSMRQLAHNIQYDNRFYDLYSQVIYE